MKSWRIEHNGVDIQKFDVPTALSRINNKNDFQKTIKSGFKCCELYPLDPKAINYERCIKQASASNLDECKQSEERTAEKSLTKQESLEYVEKNINSNILQQFKNLKSTKSDWNGGVEYSALFDKWSKIYDDAHSEQRPLDESLELKSRYCGNVCKRMSQYS